MCVFGSKKSAMLNSHLLFKIVAGYMKLLKFMLNEKFEYIEWYFTCRTNKNCQITPHLTTITFCTISGKFSSCDSSEIISQKTYTTTFKITTFKMGKR